MRKVVVEEEVVVRYGDSGNGAANSAIWAIAMIIIVALIAGAVYYSGILKTAPARQKLDVERFSSAGSMKNTRRAENDSTRRIPGRYKLFCVNGH